MEVALSIHIRVPSAGCRFAWEGFTLKTKIFALAVAPAMPAMALISDARAATVTLIDFTFEPPETSGLMAVGGRTSASFIVSGSVNQPVMFSLNGAGW
jgi:hypothetical protein